MAKATTPSFVLELELLVSSHERKTLYKKLNIGRQVYNACLGEALKRLHKIQHDRAYGLLLQELNPIKQKLQALEKSEQPPIKQLRELKRQKTYIQSELKSIELHYGYSEYQLQAWTTGCSQHFSGHIGSLEIQKLATRAFYAVEKLHYHTAKKVHFKRKNELISIENKSNKTGLRWMDGKVIWFGLKLDVRIRKKDEYAKDALKNRVKYLRIVPRTIRGKERYFVQFILEGYPPLKKHTVLGPIDERVGIDPGTSTMAISSEYVVSLEELAPTFAVDDRKLRRIQRAMDRSRRSTNPENYNTDGTIKIGKKTWIYSNRYRNLAIKRKELYRRIAAKRKESHEKLANKILSIGMDVRVEEMKYQALQKRAKQTKINRKNGKLNKKKRFGKSLGNRAPAMFLSILDRKLHYYDQELKKVNTRELKASQFNHVTGEYIKKELKERWNVINGHKVQRDLYSAFLLENTNEDLETVNMKRINQQYESFLELHDKEILNIKKTGSKTLQWYIA